MTLTYRQLIRAECFKKGITSRSKTAEAGMVPASDVTWSEAAVVRAARALRLQCHD